MFNNEKLPEPIWGEENFISRAEQIKPELDRLVHLYKEKLLTFEEIAKEAGIDWWVIKELFKKEEIQTISLLYQIGRN